MTRIILLARAAGRRGTGAALDHRFSSRSLGFSCRGLSLSPLAESEFLGALSLSPQHPRLHSSGPGKGSSEECALDRNSRARVNHESGDSSDVSVGHLLFNSDGSTCTGHGAQKQGSVPDPGFWEAQACQQHLLPRHPQRRFHSHRVEQAAAQALAATNPGFGGLSEFGARNSSTLMSASHGVPLISQYQAALHLLNPGWQHHTIRHVSATPDHGRAAAGTPATSAGATSAGATSAAPGAAPGSKPVSTAAVQEELAEDCDEAVEDLGEVKARVRAAKEAVRKGKGVLRASALLVSAVARKVVQGVWSMRVVFTWTRKDWADTFAGWGSAIRHAAHHYWVGTKLLWADIRISSRLFLKTANGVALTRRERQQLMRTSADIFRLVPFAVFVIVPFMEFLLPVALRLFPNMLPSTYQDAKQEEVKLKRVLQARLQMAKFLQDTVQEMAVEVKGRRKGDTKKTAEALQKFMTRVRTGGRVSNEEIMGFASLFNDELTLDNMTRPRLVSMCKYMGLQTFGTDAYLRYILRARLAWIKADDRMIQAEGVDSLSEAELRSACRERGMLGLRDIPSMRLQLQDWLDLSLNRSVPSSLLILSRAFLLAGKVRPEEAVQATLSSLPEQVVASVGASVPKGETSVSERQRKLDRLREEEELIKEEAAEEDRRKKSELETAKMQDTLDKALEEMRPDTGAASTLADVASSGEVELSKEDRRSLSQSLLAQAKKEELCDLSAALAVLASSSAVSKERMDFLRLVNREIELYNSLVETTGQEGEETARAAYHAAREASEKEAETAVEKEDEEISEALINKVDTMLHQLEKELDRVDAKIGAKLRILDTDYDGKVTPEEVAAAAALLRDSLGQGHVPELIANLAKDKDGKILVEDIVRLGTMDSKEEGDGGKKTQAL